MQIIKTPHDNDLRFWLVRAAANEIPPTFENRHERQKLTHAANTRIKAAGFKAAYWGMRSAITARLLASKIEKQTGVEMSISKHDYL